MPSGSDRFFYFDGFAPIVVQNPSESDICSTSKNKRNYGIHFQSHHRR